MRNEFTALEWVAKYDAACAEMVKGNIKPMQELTDYTWYDWFCNSESLLKKTISLGKKVKFIVESGAVDANKTYVWFKNNCPMVGTLYDDIRFSDMKTGDNQLVIAPRSGHTSKMGMGEVYGVDNDFDEALYTGLWCNIKKWLKTEAPRKNPVKEG